MEIPEELLGDPDLALSIFNTVRDPLIILDTDQRVLLASDSFYKDYGISKKKSIGKLIYDIGEKEWDIPDLRALLKRILSSKKAFNNFEIEHDFNRIGRRIVLFNARKIRRAKGKAGLILLSIRDITASRKQVIQLERSEKKYRSIFQTSANFIVQVDSKGIVEECSLHSEHVLGLRKSELMGKPLLGFIRKDYKPAFRKILKDTFESGITKEQEFALVGNKNRRIFCIINFSSLVIVGEKHSSVICLIIDITKRKEAEDMIKNAKNLLEKDVAAKTIELSDQISELNRIMALTVGRELKMVELKKKIKRLEEDISDLKRKKITRVS